ncbi:MAG: glycosyltransferase [Alphaproteobacteria bacterium]|nr:glycosyltransferase [Alphaproteobacteria bacterium]
MKKILHITESLGGGTATALFAYVRNAPQAEHHLLAAVRAGDDNGLAWKNTVAGLHTLPRGLFAPVREIRRVYRQLQPDWIHLHSSFAGAWGRMSGLPRAKIIYTPHCYAFERRDITAPLRAAYFMIEQGLAFMGGTLAAVGPHEAALGRRMLARQRIVPLPNAVAVPPHLVQLRKTRQAKQVPPLRVAMVGRAAPQKDPGFFAATAALARHNNVRASFVWLGGGDTAAEAVLRDAGVEVSGWLSHADILTRLADCDLYYHTAAWEACPMSVLEAAQLDLPILARGIPALAALPVNETVNTPAAATEVIAMLAGGQGWEAFRQNALVLRANYNEEAQRQALAGLYGLEQT